MWSASKWYKHKIWLQVVKSLSFSKVYCRCCQSSVPASCGRSHTGTPLPLCPSNTLSMCSESLPETHTDERVRAWMCVLRVSGSNCDVVGLWTEVSVFSAAGGRLHSPDSGWLLAAGDGPEAGQRRLSLPPEPELPAPGPLRSGRTALARTWACWHGDTRSGVTWEGQVRTVTHRMSTCWDLSKTLLESCFLKNQREFYKLVNNFKLHKEIQLL